jgi:ABC-2 type transport system ATP-binding protein
MLEIKNLTKLYNKVAALQDINLSFADDKIYGLLGRNGAGKTTLVNIITNRAFATSGEVFINGEVAKENENVQSKIFCITEKSEYPAYLKIKTAFVWAKRFYPSFDMGYAMELSKKFDLDINKTFKKLSTGYRTIAKVVLTFASSAPILILDEPVLGIDVIYREVFYKELINLHKKNKNLIILATHLLDEIENIADKIVVLKNGKIEYDGDKIKNLRDFYVKLHKGGRDE